MIRRFIPRICASHQTFGFIHLGDDVGAGASRPNETYVEDFCFKRLTKPKFLSRMTSVGQSMQSTQFLFSTQMLGALEYKESRERESK